MILLANCSRFHPLSRAEEALLPIPGNCRHLNYPGRAYDLQPPRQAAAVKRGSTLSSLTHDLREN
jgi:hypothetical protein